MLRYAAEQIGWTLIDEAEALRRRGGEAGRVFVQRFTEQFGKLNAAAGQDLPAHPMSEGPRVVYGEACRLGPKSLEQYGITFRQVPFELKVD